MHVAQKCPAVWEDDVHKNKDQKYACSKLHATYFRAKVKA
ncbi:hypothetical protein ACVIDN_005059 [Rhizobium brockwellii]